MTLARLVSQSGLNARNHGVTFFSMHSFFSVMHHAAAHSCSRAPPRSYADPGRRLLQLCVGRALPQLWWLAGTIPEWHCGLCASRQSCARVSAPTSLKTAPNVPNKGARRGAKCASAAHDGGAPLGFQPVHTPAQTRRSSRGVGNIPDTASISRRHRHRGAQASSPLIQPPARYR